MSSSSCARGDVRAYADDDDDVEAHRPPIARRASCGPRSRITRVDRSMSMSMSIEFELDRGVHPIDREGRSRGVVIGGLVMSPKGVR